MFCAPRVQTVPTHRSAAIHYAYRLPVLSRRPGGDAERLRALIRHSKTDQEGQGAEIAIPRGYRLRAGRGRPDLAGRGRD
jgi:hypothetical protein